MSSNLTSIEQETYFLIAKFLEDGPCKEAAEALRREIETNQLLPRRTDWSGNTHPQTVNDMQSLNHHVSSQHIINLLSKLPGYVENAVPTKVPNVNSLLTTGNFSLLRTRPVTLKPRTSTIEAACFHGNPVLPPVSTQGSNLVLALIGRSVSGTSGIRNVVTGCNIFSKVSMHKRILGHLASVYCVLFDRTGHVIATGADDNLVKLWSSFDGRLLATLRGHSGEISDLAINHENTLIAAGSCDKTIRVWSMETTAPVAVLQGHTGMITSLQFCPSAHEDARYLMSTGGDGTVCFWKWDIKTNHFETAPVKFNEKSRPGAQMLCSSFSPGGGFLVTGSSDNIIRIYQMMPAPVEKIAELSTHIDHVDSIQFSHAGCRFASGSRDGTARIWQFQRNEWKHITLNAYERLKSAPSFLDEESLKSLKLKVTMVGWNVNDHFLVTAVTDHSLKVWDSFTGDLVHILVGHSDEVFVLECHPHEPYIYLSAGHDGNVILWDILKGVMIKSFFNLLEGQGHGAIFDSRFSPNGMAFAVSDSHGHLCIFGFGSDERYNRVPYEQFFHTDYRPLIRDGNNFVLDEQTQMAPHLMPPPFLVDVDGNPHPPFYQLLIPGRNANNLPTRRVEIPVSDLPPLLAEIAAEEAAAAGRQNLLSPERRRRSSRSPLRSPGGGGGGGGGGGLGLRQSGDVEGVRLMDSNVFISQDVSSAEMAQWRNRKIVPLQKECLRKRNELYRQDKGKEEIEKYSKEKKRRALSSSQRLSKINNQEAEGKTAKKTARKGRAAPRQRISYTVPSEMLQTNFDEDEDEEEEFVDVEQMISSGSDSDWNSDSSDSSEDSDWTAEVGIKTEQRESRRRRVRRVFTSEDEAEEENESDVESEVDIIMNENEEEEAEEEKKEDHEEDEKKPLKKQPSKGKKKKPKKGEVHDSNIEENKEMYEVPEWMTTMVPQKSPYVPQVGDEVYYFRQGHELYVKAVLEGNLYDINPKKQCYVKLSLKSEECCRVTSVIYNIGPPRTCSLRLAIINPETGSNTGGSFSVKYHDVPNVLDFFVLKQHYDRARLRDWKPGDRFRCDIEDVWWSGTIIRRIPFENEFPDSLFSSLEVRWDTGEKERMSPWDMEPVPDNESPVPTDEFDLPDASNIPVTDEDRMLFDYVPLASDWPDESREEAIERIGAGIEQFSELPIAGAFAYPVDIESYPDYLSTVPYPTDLNTIRLKLINKFYRRRNAMLWEIRLIETNTKLFNEENSEISQNSSTITKLLISFACDATCHDLIAFYNETVKNGGFETEEQPEKADERRKKSSKKSKSSRKKNRSKNGENAKGSRESASASSSSTGQSWLSVASDLLDFLVSREDSDPFRIPVDTDRYPDYTSVVTDPMDFSTIRKQLDNRQYDDPEVVVRDIRLVFANSRLYNTNKRSRIYGMTLRLSALFEDRVQTLLSLSNSRKKQKSKNNSKQFLENRKLEVNGDETRQRNRTHGVVQDDDNSLRLVLRRSSARNEFGRISDDLSDDETMRSSFAVGSASSSRQSSSGSRDQRSSQHSFAIGSASSSGRTSPRRTGVVLNLRTGRSRELSYENFSHSDSDGCSSKTNMKIEENLRPSKERKRKCITLQGKQRRNSRIKESSGVASVETVSNGNSSNRKDIVYSTRSGRKVRPKRLGVDTDEEKENREHVENGIKKEHTRRRITSDDSERTDEEDGEEEGINGDGNPKNEESDYETEDEHGDSEGSNVDYDENNIDDDCDFDVDPKVSKNTRQKNTTQSKTSNHRITGLTTEKKRKRNRANDESKARKSKRTRLKVNYSEDIDDETSVNEEHFTDSDEESNVLGISSRGRVRKAALRYADYVDS